MCMASRTVYSDQVPHVLHPAGVGKLAWALDVYDVPQSRVCSSCMLCGWSFTFGNVFIVELEGLIVIIRNLKPS